ncbi:MAG: alpha/beta fold hydrolase [Deltaproteobacteria bacterium]|nr:alpha/beta fold hydrolase [Deltaproteobacteria bacterium]
MSYWVELLGCETRFVKGRYRTRIVEAGEGFPLVLLHGMGGHLENFVHNIPEYAKHFRVVAMDFLWHGRSQTEGFDEQVLPALVDQVLDVLNTLKLERVYVEGQSLGGWVASLFTLKCPQRVDKLVLTTATGYLPDEEALPGSKRPNPAATIDQALGVFHDPSDGNIRKRLEQVVFDGSLITDEAVALRAKIYRDPAVNRVLREVMRNHIAGEGPTRHAITDALARQIIRPTLVYWGDKNRPGPEVGERLAAMIPGARYHCARDTGHWAQFEHYQEHNQVVLDFLLDRG